MAIVTPKFNRGISLGNVIEIAAILIAVGITWETLASGAERMERDLKSHEEDACHHISCEKLESHELEIRLLKRSLRDVEDGIERTNKKLDKLIDHLLPRRMPSYDEGGR